MNTTFQLETSADDGTEAKREIIRQSLNEIAADVANGLRDADLSYPVYLVVPGSGDAIVSMMTPLDPSDEDWSRIGDIVRTTVSERLNGLKLRNREMICGAANAPISTAEITED